MQLLKIAFVCLGLAVFIAACNQTPTTSNTAVNTVNQPANKTAANDANSLSNAPVNIPPDVAQNDTASGRKIYMEICAKCHKENGTGGKVTIEGETINAENLTSDHAKKESDEDFFKAIKNGIADEGMPAFKDRLSDAEINNVINFIRQEIQKQ